MSRNFSATTASKSAKAHGTPDSSSRGRALLRQPVAASTSPRDPCISPRCIATARKATGPVHTSSLVSRFSNASSAVADPSSFSAHACRNIAFPMSDSSPSRSRPSMSFELRSRTALSWCRDEQVGQPLVFDLKAQPGAAVRLAAASARSSQPSTAESSPRCRRPPRLLGRPDTRTTLLHLEDPVLPSRQSNRTVRIRKSTERLGSAFAEAANPTIAANKTAGSERYRAFRTFDRLQAEGRGSRVRVPAPRHGFRTALHRSACRAK